MSDSSDLKKIRHILFLVDGTGSMGDYLTALTKTVLPQCIKMTEILSGGDIKLDAIVYRDFDVSPIVKTCIDMTTDQLCQFLSLESAYGGGDYPEAQKTALNVLLSQYSQKQDNVLILHYTDAPPHHKLTESRYIEKERAALHSKVPGFDWVAICRELCARKIPMFTFLPEHRAVGHPAPDFYVMSGVARGDLIVMPDAKPETITRATIGVLSMVMGEKFEKGELFRIERSSDEFSMLMGDENSTGHLPHQTLVVPHVRVPFDQIHTVDWLQSELNLLPKKVLEDEQFRSFCFDTFKDIFCPEQVHCITYNAVLGKVWRNLCRFRDDARLSSLCNALSRCVTDLSGSEKEDLQNWISDSYDQSLEIQDLITALPMEKRVPFLVLDGSGKIEFGRKDLLSLAVGPNAGILSQVQTLLCSVVSISNPKAIMPTNSEGVPVCIPLAMDDKQLFSLICHLLYPGVMFTLKPTAIVAIVAYLGGNCLLKDRAERFLNAIKGKWLGVPVFGKDSVDENGNLLPDVLEKWKEHPELLSVEYIKLLHKVPQFLTENERGLYEMAYHFWKLRRASKKKLTVKVAFTPKKHQIWPDLKQKCTSCDIIRSLSLLKNGVCGICIYCDQGNGCLEQAWKLPEPKDCDDSRSHLVQCRTCSVLYAVVDIEHLNVDPKCHYCREGEVSPKTLCVDCGNHFLSPDGPKKDWVCSVCMHKPDSNSDEKEIYFLDLLSENAQLRSKIGLNDKSFELLFGSAPNRLKKGADQVLGTPMSFFKIFTKHMSDLWNLESENEPIQALTWNQKPVHNVDAVLKQVDAIVNDQSNLFEDCVLCFESKAVNGLSSVCGNCRNDVCKVCSTQWWSQLEPGKLVFPTHLFCPCCKQMPTSKTLRQFNKLAVCGIVGRKNLTFNANEWYAWCIGCYKIKPAATRECSAQPPTLTNYQCDDCNNRSVLDKKKCPACHAPTEKAGGCNHMTCFCGAHWCFECGKEFDKDSIYDHMNEEHGGYGF